MSAEMNVRGISSHPDAVGRTLQVVIDRWRCSHRKASLHVSGVSSDLCLAVHSGLCVSQYAHEEGDEIKKREASHCGGLPSLL